jgi:hypothetical protein
MRKPALMRARSTSKMRLRRPAAALRMGVAVSNPSTDNNLEVAPGVARSVVLDGRYYCKEACFMSATGIGIHTGARISPARPMGSFS